MATLTVSLPAGTTVCNGKQITFRAPCDCTGVTGIIINGTNYELVDTSNECISDKGNQFASGSMVSVIIDTENSRAYIQNAAVDGASVREMTYAEYQALATKDPDTFYVVTDYIPENINHKHDDRYYTEAEVDTKLNAKASKSSVVTATLLAANWTGAEAPYEYSLTVSGVTATSNQEILPDVEITPEQLEALQGANIQDGGQSVNTIVLKAYGEVPTIDLPIRVIKRGD